MATGRITIVVERDVPDSGSGSPDLGHDAYHLKKLIEADAELKGKYRVAAIETETEIT
jgi:hypothetical protein